MKKISIGLLFALMILQKTFSQEQKQFNSIITVTYDMYIMFNTFPYNLATLNFNNSEAFFRKYKLPKYGLTISLSALNLFNNKLFVTTNVNDLFFAQASYRINPLMVLIGVEFKPKPKPKTNDKKSGSSD
jgi:hypothetical protein